MQVYDPKEACPSCQGTKTDLRTGKQCRLGGQMVPLYYLRCVGCNGEWKRLGISQVELDGLLKQGERVEEA